MHSRSAYLVATLASAVVLSAGSAQDVLPPQPAPADASRLSILIQGGRVTASIEKAPLRMLLDELSQRMRIAIVSGRGLEDEEVTAEINNVPIDEAVRALLRDYDVFYYYSGGARQTSASLAGMWVYPRGTAAALRPEPPDTWASTKDLEAAVASRDPAIREQAYEALMSRPDAASRNLVILAIRGASEGDADVRQRLLSAAIAKGFELPRDALMDLARGDGTEEIRLMALDALTGDPAAREVATAALTDSSEAVRERAKGFLQELDSLARHREVIKR